MSESCKYQMAYLYRDAYIFQVNSVKTLCVGPDSCIALLPYIFHNWLHLKAIKICELMPSRASRATGCIQGLSSALHLNSQAGGAAGCQVSHVRDGSSAAYRL